MDPSTYAPIASALTSFALAMLLVLTAAHHGRFTMDLPGAIQTFHERPTPRVGGIGIYLALLGAEQFLRDGEAGSVLRTILLAGIPSLAVGLAEDVTRRVGVAMRMAATLASGALACWIAHTAVVRLDFPGLDGLLGHAPFAIAFTVFAIGGVANAFNIIDGFNGLASGTAVLCLLALAMIATLVGDTHLALAAGTIAAAIAGFWIVNFPWGRLFLGDGGAYFAGFAVAWIAVLLPARNPSVSPWASLLVCAYPIVEVLYSIARRALHKRSPGRADRGHLHSLVATHVVQRRFASLSPTLRNSAVSVIMWTGAAVPALAAIVLHQRAGLLALSAAASALAYHLIYLRVARARARP